VIRNRRDRSRTTRDRALRPLLLDVLDGEPVAVSRRRDRLHLIEIAVRASHNVRGADRATLAVWLRSAGALTEASRLLRSRSALARARGIELYLPIADGHTRILERLLTDRNRAVRSLACEALGRAAALDAIPALLAATGSGRRQLPPAMTMMAITRIRPQHAELLLGPAAALAVSVQLLAVELVGVLNLTDGRRAIEGALSHPAPALRIAALHTLAQLGLPSSLPALTEHRAIEAPEQEALTSARTALALTLGR
jgi:HEAT repeat protein